MSASVGRRRADPAKAAAGPLTTLGVIFAGVAAGTVLWLVLVRAAIAFGSSAKSGNGAAWFFMTAASLGAVACLVLVLVLINKVLIALGLAKDPAASTGGHRRAMPPST